LAYAGAIAGTSGGPIAWAHSPHGLKLQRQGPVRQSTPPPPESNQLAAV